MCHSNLNIFDPHSLNLLWLIKITQKSSVGIGPVLPVSASHNERLMTKNLFVCKAWFTFDVNVLLLDIQSHIRTF